MLPHTKLLSQPRSSNFHCCHFCCALFRIHCSHMQAYHVPTFFLCSHFCFATSVLPGMSKFSPDYRLSFKCLSLGPIQSLFSFSFVSIYWTCLDFLYIYIVFINLKKKGALQILKISLISFASFRSMEFTLANSTWFLSNITLYQIMFDCQFISRSTSNQ